MRTSIVRPFVIVAACGAAFIVSPCMAEPVEVVHAIFAQAPTSPKSAVPGGIIGIADARFTNFNNKLYRSPTSSQWLIVPTTNATPASADQVLLIGSGLTSAVVAREGTTQVGTGPGGAEFLNFSLLSVPRMNDAGQWAVGYRLAGGAAFDDRLVTWDGAAFQVFRGGDGIPALPGLTYAGSFNGANISSSGAVGFLASENGLSATTESAFGNSGGVQLIDIEVAEPSGQSAPTPQPWVDIDTNSFYQDATGIRYIALGEVGFDLAADKVVVVDGVVVLQEGSVVAGSAFTSPVSSVSSDGVWMESNGDWFARGANADGIDWVVRNGAVIAYEGQAVTPDLPTLLWETFRDVKGDNAGNYVVNGNAGGDTLTDDVLVVNGTRLVARESDPVDLDGNGQFDDNLFVHLIQDRGTLNNDGYFYFASRLKSTAAGTTGANGSNNASLLRVRAVTALCGDADFDGDGDTGTDLDIEAFFACLGGDCCATCGSADFDGDGDTGTDLDIEAFFRVLGGGDC